MASVTPAHIVKPLHYPLLLTCLGMSHRQLHAPNIDQGRARQILSCPEKYWSSLTHAAGNFLNENPIFLMVMRCHL